MTTPLEHNDQGGYCEAVLQ